MNKKTLVLGASPNPERYAYKATVLLQNYHHTVVAVGQKEADIEGLPILVGTPAVEGIDTVTLYLNPSRQEAYYGYILGLSPKRIIFNPGTENPTLVKLANEKGIETEYACTLVLLRTNSY